MGHHSIRVQARFFLLAWLALPAAIGVAQSADKRVTNTTAPQAQASEGATLAAEVGELRAMVEELRQENQTSRAEMEQLRQQLEKTQATLEKLTSTAPAQTPASASTSTSSTSATVPPNASSVEARVDKLEETQTLLNDKINEQYQTKVEAASKYHVRLSGIVLMNAFGNRGASNNFDLPDYAVATPGSFPSAVGATLRQSEIGLEVFGPNLIGAKTSANVHMDFAGGFPSTPNGVVFGIARLRTASARFDWANTSVIAGQDSLFISPLSPTSFASLATPAFAYAGNLWGWIPQVRVEHRFDLSDTEKFTIQAGVLDNLTWDLPPSSVVRDPTSGEQSGQPAYAARTSWSTQVFGHELSLGTAGYYSRQEWLGHYVDGWAGIADWQIPIAPHFTLSGEFYRGRAAGGLGAGIGRSVLFGPGPDRYGTGVRGTDSAGGWTQLKWQITPKIELNGVIAQDDVFSRDVLGFATDQNNYAPILGRNQGAFGNLIFRPRSDLILATEFRRLRTYPFYDVNSVTNQLNLAVGVLF